VTGLVLICGPAQARGGHSAHGQHFAHHTRTIIRHHSDWHSSAHFERWHPSNHGGHGDGDHGHDGGHYDGARGHGHDFSEGWHKGTFKRQWRAGDWAD
jgi:hypothetical protein